MRRSSRPSRRLDASSSSRPPAPPARPSSSRSACTFRRSSRSSTDRRFAKLAAAGKGFGIVAGTGTGKTLSIRPIAETILRTDTLKVGVVNREREATPETPTWNVIVVTTGIARRWFQDGDILPTDTLVVDEIHQTSAELELCLALGKRVGCRFIWLSATVDPTFYARYLNAAAVLETSAFDPAKAADVKIVRKDPMNFLDDRFLQQVVKEKRGVGMFLPTRAGVEQAAELVGVRFPRINTAFYHGGEPIRVIRPFLEGEEKKPYFLSMTAAGQSALNVQGLDTVVIDDTRFSNIIERGKNVLTKLHLGANEILQMAGRVHGRVAGGRVFILSDRDIQFAALQPTAPEFQLAGDSERVALTCADLGVARRPARSARPARSSRVSEGSYTARAARHHRERKTLTLRQGGRSDAGRPAVGGAAGECRRRARPLSRGDELDRVTPPDDPRGSRSLRRHRARQRSSHGLQPVRRSVLALRVHRRSVRAAHDTCSTRASRNGPSSAACWSRQSRTPHSRWPASSALSGWSCRPRW